MYVRFFIYTFRSYQPCNGSNYYHQRDACSRHQRLSTLSRANGPSYEHANAPWGFAKRIRRAPQRITRNLVCTRDINPPSRAEGYY